MTKRFTLKEYTIGDYGILDNDNEIAYASYKSAFTFCELLNELHEENQKCKEYNGILYANHTKTNRELVKQISELSEENEQCKMMIATLRNIILENGIDIE